MAWNLLFTLPTGNQLGLVTTINGRDDVKTISKALACAAVLAAPAAMAGVTGNVGAVSEYMFRGIPQVGPTTANPPAGEGNGGAAIQGGIDYSHDSGLYVGGWASNIGFAGGTEQDLYAGFLFKAGEVTLDLGAIYYMYTEEQQTGGAGGIDPNTTEVYVGATVGPVTLKYYYSPEAAFFGVPDATTGEADEGQYVSAIGAFPLSKTLNLTANLGYYFGDVIEDVLGAGEDSYMDYSLGLAKSLDGGLTASFSYVGTTIDTPAFKDEPKAVIGLKKAFDL